MTSPTGRKVVAPGQTITSEWGNAVWDQSVNVFTSPADRDSQWPSPHDGAMAYTTDSKSYWHRVGGQWLQARTELTFGWNVAGQSGFGQTPIAISGLTGSITFAAARRVRCVVTFLAQKGGADLASGAVSQILLNGSAIQQQNVDIGVNQIHAITMEARTTLAAGINGAFTATLMSTAGFVNMLGSTTYPAFMAIDDLGPG